MAIIQIYASDLRLADVLYWKRMPNEVRVRYPHIHFDHTKNLVVLSVEHGAKKVKVRFVNLVKEVIEFDRDLLVTLVGDRRDSRRIRKP
jgi:hypothetical protein